MAINPESQFVGKIKPASADYPYGEARDITLPSDGTGTPWKASLVNDLFGFQQALLSDAGIVPSNTPDKVGASQYLQSLFKSSGLVRDDYAALRLVTSDELSDKTQCFIIDSGMGGAFALDKTDVVTVDDGGITIVDADGGRWKRIYSGAIYVKWYGAKGDGVTVDSTSIKNCIQAVIDKASAILGTVVRSSPSIIFDPGVYLVGDNTFGSYTETDVRTIEFIGQGMYNTSIILNENGAIGHYTAAAKLILPVFKDIGFYGDSFLDTAANDVTNPVSSNRKLIHSNTTGVQGFKFHNCLYSRFGETFVLEGEDNESEFKFFGGKAVKNGDWMVLSNPQSVNHDHFGLDIEQYVGSIVRIPAADYSADGTSGGGSVRFFGGSIIPFDEGSARYLVEIEKGGATFNQPTVSFNDTRIELRFDNNGIAKISPLQAAIVAFNKCSFALVNSVGGTKSLASIGAYGRLEFERCTFLESGTPAIKEWTLVGSAAIYGEIGAITFNRCKGVPDVTEIDLDATGTFHGIATATNSIVENAGATTEIADVADWTVADGWWKFHSRGREVTPVHKASLINNLAPYNAIAKTVIILPEDAVILRIVGYIPPQGTSAASITYSLDDGDAVNLFTEVVAQQKNGTYFEIKPSDLVGGLGQAIIGATINARTLEFTANAGAHQQIRGFGFIEYV